MKFKNILSGFLWSILFASITAFAGLTINYFKQDWTKYNLVNPAIDQICNSSGADCLTLTGTWSWDMQSATYDPWWISDNMFDISTSSWTMPATVLYTASWATDINTPSPASWDLLIWDWTDSFDAQAVTWGLDLSNTWVAVLLHGMPEIWDAEHIDTLAELINHNLSAWIMHDWEITNNLDWTVSIWTWQALLRSSASSHKGMVAVKFNEQKNIWLADWINYIYLDYNAWSPTFNTWASITDFNCQDKCIAYTVVKTWTWLNIVDAREQNVDSNRKHRRLLLEAYGFQPVKWGSVLWAVNWTWLTVTAWAFYYWLDRIDHNAFDTSWTWTFTSWWRDWAWGWTSSWSNAFVDNFRYDDGDGVLWTVSNNDYWVHYVYIINNEPSSLAVQYWQGNYATVSEAEAAWVPVWPPQIEWVWSLIWRVIIERDADAFDQIDSALTETFAMWWATQHNWLAWIDWGTTNEYYHLTSAQHTQQLADQAVATSDDVTFNSVTAWSYTGTWAGQPIWSSYINLDSYTGSWWLHTVWTVGTGTWQWDVIDIAYLDTDAYTGSWGITLLWTVTWAWQWQTIASSYLNFDWYTGSWWLVTVWTIATWVWNADVIHLDYLWLDTYAGTGTITTVGTIWAWTWQGDAVADWYISSAATWNAKQDALTFWIANTNAVDMDATAVDDDYAKFTANWLEGRTYTEVKTDLSLENVENTALSTWAWTTNITTLWTVTWAWQGQVINESYLDLDAYTWSWGITLLGTVTWAWQWQVINEAYLDLDAYTWSWWLVTVWTIATGTWEADVINATYLDLDAYTWSSGLVTWGDMTLPSLTVTWSVTVEGGKPIVNTSDTAITLGSTWAWVMFETTANAFTTVTIPLHSTTTFQTWASIDFFQVWTWTIIFTWATAWVTINSYGWYLNTAGQYAWASLYKRANDVWALIGNLTE